MYIGRMICFMCGLLCLGCAWAQPRITLKRDIANMGEIMFQKPAEVKFVLHNSGNEPLKIKEVIPSCGCTSVEWTTEAVAPGADATVTAVYDAKMLGVYQKDLEVYTNASEEPFYLHFQGRVVTKLTDYSGSFPIELGTVRLNMNNVEFDNVNRGDRPMVELEVVNTGRKSYKPELMHVPPYLSVRYLPEVLNGGRLGKIQLTLDSEKLPRMGLTQTSVYLSREQGDRISEENEITVSAVLLPDFSSLSVRERGMAPHLVLASDTLFVENVGRRNKSVTVLLGNAGRDTLEVRALQLFNKALSVKLGDRNIAPDETVKMKVTVQAKYLNKVKSTPRILLITNDPACPKKIITVKVTNKEAKKSWNIRKIAKNIKGWW